MSVEVASAVVYITDADVVRAMKWPKRSIELDWYAGLWSIKTAPITSRPIGASLFLVEAERAQ